MTDDVDIDVGRLTVINAARLNVIFTEMAAVAREHNEPAEMS